MAFLLELVAFYFFATLGFGFALPRELQYAGTAFLLVMVISIWSIYMAPRAPRRLTGTAYYVIKFSVYVVAGLSLYRQTGIMPAIGFGLLTAIDEVLLARR